MKNQPSKTVARALQQRIAAAGVVRVIDRGLPSYGEEGRVIDIQRGRATVQLSSGHKTLRLNQLQAVE